ncbi:MAG: hypothetical protein HY526_07310 [Betaproteobacteria bacterium]|nr:hypothetical protein [Betaproteobacteria bacterium]
MKGIALRDGRWQVREFSFFRARIHDAREQQCGLPPVAVRRAAVGSEPMTSTPEQFTEFYRKEVARWGRVIRASGATAE